MTRILIGTVVSDKPDKTIIVGVQTRKTHTLYKKQYTQIQRFMAHDGKNEAHTGDRVSISETRPLSARKRYILKEIIERPTIAQEQQIDVIEQADKGNVKEKGIEDKE